MSALFCLRQHFKIWNFDQDFPLKKKNSITVENDFTGEKKKYFFFAKVTP